MFYRWANVWAAALTIYIYGLTANRPLVVFLHLRSACESVQDTYAEK